MLYNVQIYQYHHINMQTHKYDISINSVLCTCKLETITNINKSCSVLLTLLLQLQITDLELTGDEQEKWKLENRNF
jgi:hypothetical protein